MDQAAQPQRLRALRIENLRGIDHLELELPEPDEQGGGMLVLAGANGCGKTTVLEAVLMTLRRIDLLPRDLAAPSELVRQGASDFQIESRWWQDKGIHWQVDRRELTSMMESFAREATVTQSVEGHARPLSKDLQPALHPPEFHVEYISSRREPEDLGEPVAGPRGRRSTREERRLAELQRRLVNSYGRLGSERIFQRLNRFYGFFVGSQWRLDVIYRSAELGSERVVVVRDGELPASDQGVEINLDALRARAAQGEPTPRVIPVDRLSSGQMALLAMAFPFLFGELDLCLIDEPEQHLHPTWQRVLLRALRELSPKTQFLVATHSPLVLDSVYSFERVLLTDDLDDRPRPLSDAAA